MSDLADQRNLDPTPRRRQKAREQGRVAHSRDLVSAATFLLGLVLLLAFGGGLVGFLSQYMAGQLGGRAWVSLDVASVQFHLADVARGLSRYLLPLVGLLAFGAVAASLAQTGFLLLPKRVAPDLGRLDPLRGLQRLFSGEGAARLGLGLLKIAVIGSIVGLDLHAQRDAILSMGESSLSRMAATASGIVLGTLLKVAMALLVLAVFDYGVRRWKHERELMMTSQEFREEMRELEGDPAIRSRRRRVQRQLAEGRERQDGSG
ncbi:MAG TPA: hypothetical protein DD670_11970 [Planctomycetaceae bacterium]|nr:hypothetical protein [Planctomycetaceae bacterium]